MALTESRDTPKQDGSALCKCGDARLRHQADAYCKVPLCGCRKYRPKEPTGGGESD